jgi:cytosine/adenosine deaminase-related metal-dependent hydrolase
MLVLPGLVETHWHPGPRCSSLSGDTADRGYFPTSRTIGLHYTPTDMYRATRLAAWSAPRDHVPARLVPQRSLAGAQRQIWALRESGLRARFSYGTPTGASNDAPIDLADLKRLHDGWSEYSNGGRLTLGLAWRGAASEASLRDYAAAKDLGLPISVHANNFQSSAAASRRSRPTSCSGPTCRSSTRSGPRPRRLKRLPRAARR